MNFVTEDIPSDETSLPRDEAPVTDDAPDYDPAYPGSTPDAPYGFKADGTPYKRRPSGPRTSSSGRGNMPASNSQATQAAALLGRGNMLIAMIAGFAGMPKTAAQITESNSAFEEMARDALLTDPALCRKILSTGSTSGKAGLVLAYAMLGGSLYPTVKEEIVALRAREDEDYE